MIEIKLCDDDILRQFRNGKAFKWWDGTNWHFIDSGLTKLERALK